MSDQEVINWLTRLKNSIDGKFESETELKVALEIAIKRISEDTEYSER